MIIGLVLAGIMLFILAVVSDNGGFAVIGAMILVVAAVAITGYIGYEMDYIDVLASGTRTDVSAYGVQKTADVITLSVDASTGKNMVTFKLDDSTLVTEPVNATEIGGVESLAVSYLYLKEDTLVKYDEPHKPFGVSGSKYHEDMEKLEQLFTIKHGVYGAKLIEK